MRRRMLLLFLCGSAGLHQDALHGAPAKAAPDNRAALNARYAAEYPAFHAKWEAAVEAPDTNAFMTLLAAPAPQVKDVERMMSRSLADLYVQNGLSPWIAFVERDAPATAVLAGGKLHLNFRVTFSTVMGDRDRMASITDFATRPALPYLLGDASKGWMPGRTKEGNPVINGWIDQSVWLKIPVAAEVGPLPFTAYALSYGSQDGMVQEKQQERKFAVQIVAPPAPTAENVLCVWAYGMNRARWLSDHVDKSPMERGLRIRQLTWVDDLLTQFAAHAPLTELVYDLRAAAPYADGVQGYLKEIQATE